MFYCTHFIFFKTRCNAFCGVLETQSGSKIKWLWHMDGATIACHVLDTCCCKMLLHIIEKSIPPIATILLPQNKQMFRAYVHYMCIGKQEVVNIQCEVIHKIHSSASICQVVTLFDLAANTCSFFVSYMSWRLFKTGGRSTLRGSVWQILRNSQAWTYWIPWEL